MQTILVTGASGFVGRTLRGMAQSGEIGGSARILPLPDEVDLRDPESLKRALAGDAPDAVVHLAAITFVPESFARPHDTYAVNLHGTINLLETLNQEGFRGAFLYVSSGDVYGAVTPGALPVTEDHLPRPRNPYAASKVAAEAYCYQISQTSKVRVVIARPFNHIGPGQSERFVLPALAKQIMEIKQGRRAPAVEVGNIDVTRDFSDVRDVVRAYLSLLEAGTSGEAYNVCSGIERHVREVLQRMLELADVKASVNCVADKVRPNEQTRHCGSNRKLCEDTGWRPSIPFEQSLRDLLESWKNPLNDG
jgi:GDP-4-dehydro-6-deoxy-D-mannose reductase